MQLSNVKIGHMTKFCQRPRSKELKQVKNRLKTMNICLFWPNLGLILPLEIWMLTEFGHLANFDITNVDMNGKCLN